MEAGALYAVVSVAAVGFCMAVATLGPSVGQGIATMKAVEAIARQPEVSGKIMTALLLGLAMMESLTLYAFVIALMILFVKPFAGFF